MKRKTLSEQEKLDWLRLARTPQIGPITFRQLLGRFGSAKEALNVLPDLARRGGRKTPLAAPPEKEIEAEIRAVQKGGGSFLFLCEVYYPALLAEIEDPPPVLTALGDTSLLHKDQIGIVGARNASLNGRKMAEKLASDLGTAGYVIASGLARGIDTSAHHKALPTGTVAVLAGGADNVYPEENRPLYNQIRESGCILAEQGWGTEPKANLFPKRNRLISGLSLGIVVVEAAPRSGSLITARMALDQGREVFAVPGSPLDPRANGTNGLIRQGAVITEKAADVLEQIRRPRNLLSEPAADPFEAPIYCPSEEDVEQARAEILENLSTSPISVDELVRECQLSLPLVHAVLLELELAGRLDRQPGHKVALTGF
ncbi:MAG: DNA-processing protein DprA [Alphaproteobacteria bacterium]|nr:DNA-processing protein DprA [Alphaproteobacteria bacterium]